MKQDPRRDNSKELIVRKWRRRRVISRAFQLLPRRGIWRPISLSAVKALTRWVNAEVQHKKVFQRIAKAPPPLHLSGDSSSPFQTFFSCTSSNRAPRFGLLVDHYGQNSIFSQPEGYMHTSASLARYLSSIWRHVNIFVLVHWLVFVIHSISDPPSSPTFFSIIKMISQRVIVSSK